MTLMTALALKVDGVATWVHNTHVLLADPFLVREDFILTRQLSKDKNSPPEAQVALTATFVPMMILLTPVSGRAKPS